jgi:hypothetical protein
MTFEIVKRANLNDALSKIIISELGMSEFEVPQLLSTIEEFLQDAQEDISICIEYPYVDKLFRNTFYHYWSGKHKKYHRDCIRLSFFKTDLQINDFYRTDKIGNLQESFLGFLVLRPVKRIIGRNILRPDFYKKKKKVYVAVTPGEASINGIKFKIEGFPHCSQDAEMIVCAETAVWSLMEYFSYRYNDHKSLLPKTIHKILSNSSAIRQVPSVGLNGGQIAFVLKKVGFGVQLYSSDVHSEQEFFNILRIYTESCIPIMAIISNNLGTAHVMNIVGRTELKPNTTFSVMDRMESGSNLYSFYEQPAEYLVVDDNLRPYSHINLNNPAINYGDGNKFTGCTIKAAIVPLYPSIYTEPHKAFEFVIEYLKQLDTLLGLDSYVVRILLSSTRSYKHYVALNPHLPDNVKTLLISTPMPKFIWICELSTIEQASAPDKKACGLVILDATEPRNPEVIFTLVKNLYIGILNNKYGIYTVPLPPFSIFYNLKPF